MIHYKIYSSLLALMLSGQTSMAQKQWTLQECIDYALANNISLKQRSITAKSSHEDVLQSRSALFPSVSFSTNHNMSYRPFAIQTVHLTDGSLTTTSNSLAYNGSYGINANWTVWNGNRNYNTIKNNKLTEQKNELAAEQQANSIQEQIVQLYVQCLYEAEAIKVNEQIVAASKMQADRARIMVEVGSLANVDLVQLEAQVAQDQYSLVAAQSQLANFKLQLKQLLEIHNDDPFEVAVPDANDAILFGTVPNKVEVYNSALANRPEIKSSRLNVETSNIAIKTARAGYMPTINMSAGVGSNTSSMGDNGWGMQFKNNLSMSLGLTLSVPIFDNLQARTNIRKAKYSLTTSQLDLENQQKQLYSSIEKYWLDATNSQQQYLYALKNAESMQHSYELVSEQFNLGLKNIVELTTGKNNLLQAEQTLLQSKYTALLNFALLRFYKGEKLTL